MMGKRKENIQRLKDLKFEKKVKVEPKVEPKKPKKKKAKKVKE